MRKFVDISANKARLDVKEPGWKRFFSWPGQLKRPSPLEDPPDRNRLLQDRETRDKTASRSDILTTRLK